VLKFLDNSTGSGYSVCQEVGDGNARK